MALVGGVVLAEKISVAARGPSADGENWTPSVHVAPAGSGTGEQSSPASAKSPGLTPPSVGRFISSGAAPVLVTVTGVAGLVAPTTCPPRFHGPSAVSEVPGGMVRSNVWNGPSSPAS